MKNNFDFIAPVYGILAKIVFGNKLLRAKTYYLEEITENSNVLIIGGGNGEILSLLNRLKPAHVDFVEKSHRMLKRAKRRRTDYSINFHQEDYALFQPIRKYDVILTFFFLDILPENEVKDTITKLYTELDSKGKWLFTDFYHSDNISNQLLISAMYRFFTLVSNIKVAMLPRFDLVFHDLGISSVKKIFFSNNLICSAVFEK